MDISSRIRDISALKSSRRPGRGISPDWNRNEREGREDGATIFLF